MLLLCLGVVIGEALAWVLIACAVTVIALLAFAGLVAGDSPSGGIERVSISPEQVHGPVVTSSAPRRLNGDPSRTMHIGRISEFRGAGLTLYRRKITSDSELATWQTDVIRWRDDVTTWLRESLGEAAVDDFLDMTNLMAADVMGSYNAEHSHGRLVLSHLVTNLRQLRDAL